MFIFTGAGMSTYIEIPDMQGFKGLLDEEMHDHTVYSDIKEYMLPEFDLETIMTILSDLSKQTKLLLGTIAPRTAEFLLLSQGMRKKYLNNDNIEEAGRALDQVRRVIFETCIGNVDKNMSRVVALYDALFKLIAHSQVMAKQPHTTGDKKVHFPKELCLATTNWDDALERYWECHETVITDALEEDRIKKKYRLSIEYGTYSGDPCLFKLHGSVNLFRKGVDIFREKVSVEEIKKLGIEEVVRKYGELTLVYPIEAAGHEYVTQSPYLDMFSEFRRVLVKETRAGSIWLIMGTSLRDYTLCSAMEYSLSQKDSGEWPTILLIDRNSTHRKSSLKNKFPRLYERITAKDGSLDPDGFLELETWFKQFPT